MVIVALMYCFTGSESAVKLIAAWEQRQKELKDAMKDMLNAAQYMKSIANVLSDDKISNTGFYYSSASMNACTWLHTYYIRREAGIVARVGRAPM